MDSLRMTTHGVKAPETVKGEYVSRVIPNYVQKKIDRGFERLYVTDLARELRSDYLYRTARQSPPESVAEVVELIRARSSLNIVYPHHFRPYIEALESIPEKQLRLVFHAPPQHGKSLTTLISLAYLALTRKNFVSAYCTYNSFRALSAMNDDFVPLLVALGVDFFVKNNVVHIKGLGDRRDRVSTNKILFTSRGSSLTGFAFNGVIVIDDIIKNEEEAMSPAIQEKVWSWYTREVLTRESKHLSIITMMTRWSNSDLAGKILKDRGEEADYIRIPAIADDENDPLGREIGAPLWPEEGRDLAFLERKRAEVGERAWFAMYQGTPSSEDKLFDPTSWVDTLPPLPPNRTITVYGIDLAYSAKRRSDYSVIVKVVVDKLNGVAYLVDAHRRQCLYTDFIQDIKSFVNEPGSIHWHAGSMEEHTVGAQLRRELPGMRIHKAVKSKVVRAKDTVKHWNAGRILVLNKGNLRTVAPIIELFDGVEGHEDDVVDALVSAIEPVKAFLEARPERVTKVDNSARLQRIEDRGLRRGGLRRNTGSLRKRML